MKNIGFKIRKIEKKDRARVIIFNYELYKHSSGSLGFDQRRGYSEFEVGKIDKAIGEGRGFIAEFSNSPQGYLIFSLRKGAVLIEDLYVHTFLRGFDIGKELVKTAAKEANKRASFLEVVLFNRGHPFYQDSLKFYKKLGFKPECNSLRLALRGDRLARLLFQEN